MTDSVQPLPAAPATDTPPFGPRPSLPALTVTREQVADSTQLIGHPDPNREYRGAGNTPARIYELQGLGYQYCEDPNVAFAGNPQSLGKSERKYLGGLDHGDTVLMECSKALKAQRDALKARKNYEREHVRETKAALAIENPHTGQWASRGIGDIYTGPDPEASPHPRSDAALDHLQREVADLKAQLARTDRADLATEAIAEVADATKIDLVGGKKSYLIEHNPLAKLTR